MPLYPDEKGIDWNDPNEFVVVFGLERYAAFSRQVFQFRTLARIRAHTPRVAQPFRATYHQRERPKTSGLKGSSLKEALHFLAFNVGESPALALNVANLSIPNDNDIVVP